MSIAPNFKKCSSRAGSVPLKMLISHCFHPTPLENSTMICYAQVNVSRSQVTLPIFLGPL